ncbi:Rad4 beta-hairpin domain 1-domain-containing protein [Mycena floridula]|nr:Rad4 beta-hairpin domain 1-domain-containing protein [Mycena floridula]
MQAWEEKDDKPVISSISHPYRLNRDDVEDEELDTAQIMEGMSMTINGFKDHPLYVLTRHLKQNEIIHPAPPATPQLGKFRGEPVYPRSSIVSLKTPENWLRSEGRVIKEGVQPLKSIKLRTSTVVWQRELEILREGLREAGQSQESEPWLIRNRSRSRLSWTHPLFHSSALSISPKRRFVTEYVRSDRDYMRGKGRWVVPDKDNNAEVESEWDAAPRQMNSSGSRHELRKLYTFVELIEEATFEAITPRDFASKIFPSSSMGTINSSSDTRKCAKGLSDPIRSCHSEICPKGRQFLRHNIRKSDEITQETPISLQVQI